MGVQYEWELIGEIVLAMLLAGLIGLEREVANRPAGFRTHMLVAGAAALFVGMADALVNRTAALAHSDLIAADPIRVLQAIVIGVSFLGAGTIFRRSGTDEVQGLTTGAALLLSAGIGVAVALRHFVLAIGTAILVAVVLRIIGRIERRLHREPPADNL